MTILKGIDDMYAFERKYKAPYIGYISPEGDIFRFTTDADGPFLFNSHDSIKNEIADTFLTFLPYIVLGTNYGEFSSSFQDFLDSEEYKSLVELNTYPGMVEEYHLGSRRDELLGSNKPTYFKLLESLNKDFKESLVEEPTESLKLRVALTDFFCNAQKNRRFFDAIGRVISVENRFKIRWRIEKQYRHLNLRNSEIERFCDIEIRKHLLSHLKDILVQYVGYDSIERITPDNRFVSDELKNEEPEDINRVVTTSCPNPNERFYDVRVMTDWNIRRLPRYYYDEELGVYRTMPSLEYHFNEKEEKLEKEISALRKLPKEERIRYLR